MQKNSGNIKVVPAKTKKLIYQEANSTCPFCGERDVNVLELHHIESRAAGGNNEAKNLILVCSNCHSKITEGVIGIREVHKTKADMQRRLLRSGAARSTSNVIQFNRSINQGIVANNLHIAAPQRSIRIGPPTGTVAANRDMRNYVKYLIDRYNEFKKADSNVEDFRYAVIYQSIKREFKCKWDYIPIEKFPLLVEYLQRRIDKTILGKVNKSRGKRRYSTFEEYTAELS